MSRMKQHKAIKPKSISGFVHKFQGSDDKSKGALHKKKSAATNIRSSGIPAKSSGRST